MFTIELVLMSGIKSVVIPINGHQKHLINVLGQSNLKRARVECKMTIL